MKNSLKQYLYHFETIMNTQSFKACFLFMIFVAVFSFFLIFEQEFLPATLFVLARGWLQLIVIFELFLITTSTYYTFEKDTEYIIRLGDKKTYLKRLIKQVLFNNTLIYILQFLLTEIGVLITLKNGLGNTTYSMYSISMFSYVIFYGIKIYLLYMGLSIASILLFKVIPKEVVIGINGIIATLLVVSIEGGIQIGFIPILFHDQMKVIIYDSFLKEIISAGIYILLFYLLLYLLYQFVYYTFLEIGD